MSCPYVNSALPRFLFSDSLLLPGDVEFELSFPFSLSLSSPFCVCGNVEISQDVAQEFGVQAMPTFVLVKKGKEVDRLVGASKDELERKIQKHRAVVATR